MKCLKCGYVRKPSDDELVPEWQCPNCSVAYGKIRPQTKISDPSTGSTTESPSSSRRSIAISAPILLISGAVIAFGAFLAWMIPTPQTSNLSAPAAEAAKTPATVTVVASDEHQKPEIRKEIAEVEKRLHETEEEYAKYSGGLIKSVLGVTVATQKQTLEMLKQRESSWTFGIGLHYTADGQAFVPPANTAPLLADIEHEISEAKQSIAESEANADQYSGGLVKATLLSAAATSRQTLAMLEQKRLALRFGLPQFVAFKEQYLRTSTTAPISATLPNRVVEEKDWEIVAIDARVTETNDVWWKYAWKLTLKSTGETDHAFEATIELQDADGFVIDTSEDHNVLLSAGEEKTFTGYTLVRLPGAQRIAQAKAKVHSR